jgi:UDP:flavonoid glycosyltransferase YjiC (YdhE family)
MTFDVVLGGDWRLGGGIATAAEHEIRALAKAGLKAALLQLDTHISEGTRGLVDELSACVARGEVHLIPPSTEAVKTKLLCLHHPAVLNRGFSALANIHAERVIVIAWRAPLDATGALVFDPEAAHRNALSLFGNRVLWAPVSAVCRDNLLRAAPQLPVCEDDWVNFVFAEEWSTERGDWRGALPVIGRHSRPEWEKWPDSADLLLSIYPDSDDVKVRFLGAGERVGELVNPIPSNWTLLEWNSVPPANFLRGLDFFVYYHHSTWIEAFGRNILEALASGCVAILPTYLQATFGDAALYAEPGEAAALVRRLRSDRAAYEAQTSIGQSRAKERFGPQKYLRVVGELLGVPRLHEQLPAQSALPTVAGDPRERGFVRHIDADEYDVVYAGPFAGDRDTTARIAEEIRINAAIGYRTGLLDLGEVKNGKALAASLTDTLHSGAAQLLNEPRRWTACKLLVVTPPIPSAWKHAGLAPRIHADACLIVPEQAYEDDALSDHACMSEVFGPSVTWAAQTPPLRARLASVPLERSLWSPSIAKPPPVHRTLVRKRLVIGRAGLAEPDNWPEASVARMVYEGSEHVEVAALDWPRNGISGLSSPPDDWLLFDSTCIELGKFIRKLDLLVYYPGKGAKDLPLTAIALALVNAIPVLLPVELRHIVGRGPLYLRADEARATILRAAADPNYLQRLRADAGNLGAMLFGQQHHIKRMAQAVRARPIAAPQRSRGERVARALLVSSNGTGLGHVARLLAIARRFSGSVESIFATMGHAVPLVRQFGYAAEYIPSPVYTGTDGQDWNRWLHVQLEQMVEFYRPDLVAFDGNIPPAGLLSAVGRRSGVKLAWIRRGLWQQKQSDVLASQRYFDIVLEPGDIAGSRDQGATARARDGVHMLPPIRLLDEEDLLPRKSAAKMLGLNPRDPAVLIQLGSGSNRDVLGLLDRIVPLLKQVPRLQIAIAEWAISADPMQMWPGTVRVRGFPISQYLRAFDFTIAAAGYNSFNEIISFALPAIFMANTHHSMDAQSTRADFAEEHGAAMTLDPTKLGQLSHIVPVLLNEKARDFRQANCRRLAQPNGAGEAAQLLESLL